MPQRQQAAALSTSASCSASGGSADAPSTDAGGDALLWSAQAQPSTAVCTDESSGSECEAQSHDAAQPPHQQPQPLLVQWLASADAATRHHAAGVMAAVNVATAISLMCSNPALSSLAWCTPLHMPAAPAAAVTPCGDGSGPAPAAVEAPSHPASTPLETATERRKRPSGAADEACHPAPKRRSQDLGRRP